MLYNIEFNMFFDTLVNNAKAGDGSLNYVYVLITNNGNPISGQRVTFNITSGAAMFGNLIQNITILTDENGKAIVSFADRDRETGIITAKLSIANIEANPRYYTFT